MLKLRLQRRGKKNYATYRVVVADQRAPVKGKFIDDVGFYNPHTKAFEVNAEKINEWIGKGAQPSPTVHNLLITNKIIKGEKVTSWRPKPKSAEEIEKEKKEAEETKEEKKETEEPKEAVKEEKKEAEEPKEDTKEEPKSEDKE